MRIPRFVIRLRWSSARLGSTTFLHDLHEATGLVDLELPFLDRTPELIPTDHFDAVVPTLRELNPVRSPDPAGPQSLLLRLLDGDLNADRLHHHPIPPSPAV